MSNKTEILEKLRSVREKIRTEYGVENIGLFGSFARGEGVNESSDIDILISLKQEQKTFDNYMNLKFYLESILDRRVDLVLNESVRKEFRKNISSETLYV